MSTKDTLGLPVDAGVLHVCASSKTTHRNTGRSSFRVTRGCPGSSPPTGAVPRSPPFRERQLVRAPETEQDRDCVPPQGFTKALMRCSNLVCRGSVTSPPCTDSSGVERQPYIGPSSYARWKRVSSLTLPVYAAPAARTPRGGLPWSEPDAECTVTCQRAGGSRPGLEPVEFR